jgi:hypothetical protein
MLAKVSGEPLMIDHVSADIEGFDNGELQEVLRWAKHNHDLLGFRRFLLAFISGQTELVDTIPGPELVPGIRIQYVPLLLNIHRAEFTGGWTGRSAG